jgi:GH24 family phage-related lysozyme (muramidase)
MDNFDQLLQETINTPGLLGVSDIDDERKQFEADHPTGPAPTLLGPVQPISDRAIQLIIAFEITSEALYDRLYQRPTWPKGKSGVTIGIGYDLGYVQAAQIGRDWTASLGAPAVGTLSRVCGLTGETAHQALQQVTGVTVPFSAASSVFQQTSVPRTTTETANALPGSDALSPDCMGALVSLVYNRGPSFSADGDRYTEMRAIKADVSQKNFKDIPAQLRSMKRLWASDPNAAGLVRRRELEALLFEQGLS